MPIQLPLRSPRLTICIPNPRHYIYIKKIQQQKLVANCDEKNWTDKIALPGHCWGDLNSFQVFSSALPEYVTHLWSGAESVWYIKK